MTQARCIVVDWGTSSLRAMLLDNSGNVLDRVAQPRGILAVPHGDFAAALDSACGAWCAVAPDLPVLMSGMIGSRQGWIEAPYLRAPCGFDQLAAQSVEVPDTEGKVRILPGIEVVGPSGTPEVMRGEETQVAGIVSKENIETGMFCIPGTHAKWVRVRDRRIESFATFMTGECFAVLRQHSILGRLMPEGDRENAASFERGLTEAAAPGGLLHQLFSVRTLGLTDVLSTDDLGPYLSGLLIGSEIAGAEALYGPLETAHLIAAGDLGSRYEQAFSAKGIAATCWDAEASATAGLWAMSQELERFGGDI